MGKRRAKPKTAPNRAAGGQLDQSGGEGMPERFAPVRPTAERGRHGMIETPKGVGRAGLPALVLDHDEVAKLYIAGHINSAQEQAARRVQEVWAAWKAELGISEGRSCLDIGPAGYDAGDGNPEPRRRLDAMTARLTWQQRLALDRTVCRNEKPRDMVNLRAALDIISGV